MFASFYGPRHGGTIGYDIVQWKCKRSRSPVSPLSLYAAVRRGTAADICWPTFALALAQPEVGQTSAFSEGLPRSASFSAWRRWDCAPSLSCNPNSETILALPHVEIRKTPPDLLPPDRVRPITLRASWRPEDAAKKRGVTLAVPSTNPEISGAVVAVGDLSGVYQIIEVPNPCTVRTNCVIDLH